ncbi:MAG: type II methionyl aminopeptidase [Candidatus Micrarchaeota archaeon]|nr:type II methionyl aminopeptidase [Candidatus Micrarchaeota archaeon]
MADERIEGMGGTGGGGEEADFVESVEKYAEAGRIARQVLSLARKKAAVGLGLLELAEELEKETVRLGGGVAFPANLSLNEEAAHRTAAIGDARAIGEKDVIKIDVGVHADGFVADCAFTLDFSGQHGKLVEASEEALENALAVMRAGAPVRRVGGEIQKTIAAKGFKPVENLCGHSLEQYVLHAGMEIPNVARGEYVLEEGDVFAVEPFATTGKGRVVEGAFCEIFSIEEEKPVRLPNSRKLLEFVSSEYKGLPFARRWLTGVVAQPFLDLALADLFKQGILVKYPVLCDEGRGAVSQAETTVVVEQDSVKVMV